METEFFSEGLQPATNYPEFWIGFDCGQAQDYSALAIIDRVGNRYSVVHLERLALNTPYPMQIEHLSALMHRSPLNKARKTLAIDHTGVGRPVVDLAEERGLHPVGISITGGDEASWHDKNTRARVPKRDLVSTLQVFAQNDRLKIANDLSEGPILAQELQNFKVKIDIRTAHDSYGAWREGEHDDLVLAVAIALWTAENKPLPPLIYRRISCGGSSSSSCGLGAF